MPTPDSRDLTPAFVGTGAPAPGSPERAAFVRSGVVACPARAQLAIVSNRCSHVIVSEAGPYQCPSESNDLALPLAAKRR